MKKMQVMVSIKRGEEGAFTNPSFSLKNRAGRTLWAVICFLLFRPSPRPFHAWRRIVLRLFGARLGKRCHIYPGAVIWAPWNLSCGAQSGIADGVVVYNQAPITIGRRVTISQGTHLCTGSHDYESARFDLVARPIEIYDHVWIAAECFVAPGIRIGEGAVIGARSVVLRDVPPWTVCAGHPCKVIKSRQWRPV